MADLNLVLGPVVDATISKVIALATEQLGLAWGLKDDMKKFRLIMSMVGGVLHDADEKHVNGQPKDLRAWLQELRTIVDEADDALEEVAYEDLRRKVAARKPMWKFEVSYLFTKSNHIVLRLRIANTIKNLNVYLTDINAWASQMGLQYRLAHTSTIPALRILVQTHSLMSTSQVSGRDKDVTDVVNMLTASSDSQEKLSVVSIVGMGGLGKTTLAQKVRVSDKISSHFGKILWVCVSETFDVGGILWEMLESLGGTREIKNRDTLVQEIKKKLAGGTYLLMLDDVWNEDKQKWDDLRGCLLGISEKMGNRVLVTSRSKQVAESMGTRRTHLHSLKELNAEECWSIIKGRAFGDHCSIPPELETIGRSIAEKCGGVPLVASVIGGSLCNNFDCNLWKSFQDKMEGSGSLGDQDDRRIMNILRLSFDRLPELALKQCFAFCSVFPKDFVMEKELLVQLWMGEGFLQPSGKSSMESIGEKYFDDLLAYSLFQEERKDSFGNVLACKMHDLVHDLASSITEVETVIFGGGSQSKVPDQVRHLNLINSVPTNFEDVAEKLRTLFLKRQCSTNVLKNLRRLRVFSLQHRYAEQLPLCLSKLKRLSFLDISGTSVKKLPHSISKLYNLQTLRFMACDDLEAPPVGIEDLLNLRHLYFDREKVMPAHIGRLTNLQTLKVFCVGSKKGFRIEELGSLSQLRGRLEIRNLKGVRDKSEAEGAKLREKAIEELILDFYGDREGSNRDEDVLEGLRPPSALKGLRIYGYGGKNLPSWVSGMRNLVELKITDCRMLKVIPRLDGFPSLQRVGIGDCDELSMIGDGEIVQNTSRLEELEIEGCPKLETVSIEGLSRLQKLEIYMCKKLSSIKGTSYCTALESLSLKDCGNLWCISNLDGLTSLKTIDVGPCDQHEFSPSDLSFCTALESLKIKGFRNLLCIPSLEGLTSLRTVEIEECDRLELLPDNLSSCVALESLKIRNCKNLKCIANLDGLTSLRTVEIEECDQLELLPDNLSSCVALESLMIRNCKNLKFQNLDDLSLKSLSIEGCDQLMCLPRGLSSCTALEKLEMSNCENLVFAPKELEALRSLVHLVIDNCQKLKGNPTSPEESESECLTSLASLKKLEMKSYSPGLEAFLISSINYLPSIEDLVLSAARQTYPPFPQHIQCYTSLKGLMMDGFQVESLPPSHGLGELSSLTDLTIRSSNLISIPQGLKELPSLVELYIADCPKMRRFPAAESNFSCLTGLRRLTLGPFSEDLEEFPDLSSFPPTPNLEYLCLCGWDKLTQLPHQIQHLGEGASSLKELQIYKFNGIKTLPEWLGNLSSLQSLEIVFCENLKHLPSAKAIRHLNDLGTLMCPALKERCAKDKGPEWSKISHIPNIMIM